MRNVLILGAILTALAWASPARAQSGFAAGLATAQQQVPGGILVMARQEGARYGYYFWRAPNLIEIEISGNQVARNTPTNQIPDLDRNGNPVGTGTPVPADVIRSLRGPRGVKLPTVSYLDVANRAVPGGTVTGISPSMQNGSLVFTVTVQGTDGRPVNLVINAANNQILSRS